MAVAERPAHQDGGQAGGDARRALVYEESRRALDAQQSSLDNLRTRTGVLIAATAIVSSFLGGQALGDGQFTLWSWAAIGGFFIAGLVAVVVLFPLWRWKFTSEVNTLLSDYVDDVDPATIDQMHTQLAQHNQDNYDENHKKLEKLYFGFQLACVAFILEVVCWLVDLGTRVQ